MKKDRERKLGTAHFRVDYEGLTQIIRDFWAEGEYTQALAIMTESGIAAENAKDVIRGKLKMQQYPENENQGWLVVDDWKPDLELCLWGQYPDPDDHKFFRMINRYGVKPLCEAKQVIEIAINRLRCTSYWPDKVRLIDYLRKDQKYPNEIYEFFNLPFPETVGVDCAPEDMLPYDSPWSTENFLREHKKAKERKGNLAEQLAKGGVTWTPSLDSYLQRQLEMDKITEAPSPCDIPPRIGWLSPRGLFYACNYNEHSWLSELLGYESEKAIEKEGWVKLSYSLLLPDDLTVTKGNEKKKLTQKQINALWDWSKHNKVNPDYIKEILEDDLI